MMITNGKFERMWKEIFVTYFIVHSYNSSEINFKKILKIDQDYLPLSRESNPRRLKHEAIMLDT
jgi:hypothetical protein